MSGCSYATGGKRDIGKCFIRLPSVITHQRNQTRELSKRWQNAWLAKIQREEFKPENHPHMQVCLNNFVTGKPSKLYETEHPDLVPSLKLGYDLKLRVSGDRSDRAAK